MSIGIVWTSYHYYLGEIARIISETGNSVTVYTYLESSEIFPHLEGIKFENISKLSSRELLDHISIGNHEVILVCGWHLKPFRYLAKNFHGRVVLFMDNPWKRTPKQILGILIFKLRWASYYDGVVLPGTPQKIFASHLGFKAYEIREGFFSFLRQKNFHQDIIHVQREFIFIGRLINLKGVEELAQAYGKYRSRVSEPWPLIVCGEGPLKYLLQNQPGVQMKGFLNKKELFSELSSPRVYISCSKGEHWGISIYEAAFYYHPLILSSDAGATTQYLRNGSNGISIRGRNVKDIEEAMFKFHNTGQSELSLYAKLSNELAMKHDSNFFVSQVLPFLMKGNKNNENQ